MFLGKQKGRVHLEDWGRVILNLLIIQSLQEAVEDFSLTAFFIFQGAPGGG